MLVEFTMQNFRSIRTEQTLSLYAENKHHHHEGNISFIDQNLGVLKTCAIFGSNASGKTNLILAFKALEDIILNSHSWKDGDKIRSYEPYLLSAETLSEPTSLGLEFYVEQLRFNYQIKYNEYEIIFEKLDFFPTPHSRSANLFTRNSPKDWRSVKFGDHYKGGKKQIAFFSNNAYLSKAGNSADSPEIIRKIFNFFRKNVFVFNSKNLSVGFGDYDWYEDKKNTALINSLLKKADLGINKFEFEERESTHKINLPDDMPEELKKVIQFELSRKTVFYHESDAGQLIKFDSKNESQGTIALFKLLPLFILALKSGVTLFIDEIENSLHPHIAELIIKIFNDSTINRKNAQLVFSTHNLILMNSQSMRKDQVYLVSKTPENGTTLDCLEDYDDNLKDSSPFAKWYNEGRFGAIPNINYHDISKALIEALKDA